MTTEKNAWMIEAGDVVEVMSPHRKQPTVTEADRPGDAVARAVVVRSARRRSWRIPAARSGLRFAPLVGLTYILGPLAILLTPSGRREKSMVFVAAVSYLATVLLVAFHFGQLVGVSVWAWVALVLAAVIGGFTVWARAVHLLGAEGIPHRNKLPWWFRRNWVVSCL